MSLFERWPRDPFDGLQRLQEQLERVFERPFGFDPGLSGRGALPLVNVFREEGGLVVRAEVPGFAPEDLNIEGRDSRLVISGKRERSSPSEGSFHRRERWSGEFSRAIAVPSEFDVEKATASESHGVLTVTIPLREEVKSHQIKVEAS